MTKKFVRVVVSVDECGRKYPRTIEYNDKIYDIDKIIDVSNRASLKVGGIGERYTIRIGNNITYLYCENDKWFVEEK